MKTLSIIFALMLFALTNIYSQSLITVQHGDDVWFYNYDEFHLAFDDASDGASIYLPAGGFPSPTSASNPQTKKLHIYGVGYALSDDAHGRTIINGPYYIENDSDGSTYSGIFFNTHVYIDTYAPFAPINDLTFTRCFIDGSLAQASTSAKANNLTLEECIVTSYVNSVRYSNIRNCIISQLYHVDYSNLNNCIFTNSSTSTNFQYCSYNIINNSIIVQPTKERLLNNANYNTFRNNMFVSDVVFPVGNNDGWDNITEISVNSIFQDVSQGYFSQYSNLQLQDESEGKEAGTDGTDIGVYGGQYPFKTNRLPVTPNIKNAIVGPGSSHDKIRVRINVEAQVE